MKKKNLLLISGLSLALGTGVAAGISAHKAPSMADATIWRNTVTIYFVPSDAWANESATFVMNVYNHNNEENSDKFLKGVEGTLQTATYEDRPVYAFTATNDPWISGVQFKRMDSNGENQLNYSGVINISDNYDSGVDALIMASSASGNAWNAATEGISWGESSSFVTKHTITKMAVEFVSGEAQEPADWSLGTDSVADGNVYAIPDKVTKNLEAFGGWFVDATCETAYTAREITANLTLYAKYTRLSLDSYVYWVSESESPVFDTIYAFGEYELNNVAISSYEVSNGLSFNGLTQKIYKFPIPSGADFKFILHTGNFAKQTYDITPTSHAAYYTWLNNDEEKYSWNANVNAGAALDLLFKAEELRHAVTAGTKEGKAIAADSICGIDPSDAADLYVDYEGLTTGTGSAKEMFDNSSITTYDKDNTSATTTVNYSAIMAELYKIALKDSQFALSHGASSVLAPLPSSDSTVYIAAAVGIAGVITISGLVLLRRKHQN